MSRLAFRYLRESLDAALMGREPAPPPDALMQRAETIGKELKRRGGAAAHGVLDAIEGILREEVRSPPRGTPSKPVQRLGTRHLNRQRTSTGLGAARWSLETVENGSAPVFLNSRGDSGSHEGDDPLFAPRVQPFVTTATVARPLRGFRH